MANSIHRFFVDKMGGRNINEFIGSKGDVFTDPDLGSLRVSDGITAGGIDPYSKYTQTLAMRHIAARTGIPNTISGSNTQAGFRTWNYNYVSCTSLRIWFANYYINSTVLGVETPAGGPLTVRISIEYPKGTYTPVYSTVIPDGDNGYVDVPVSIPAFAWYRINGDQNYLVTGRVLSSGWSNSMDRSNGDEYQVGPSGYNHIVDGSVLGSGSVAGVYPTAICAMSSLPVIAAVGDSIVAGVNDATADASGGRGILGRGLTDLGPHMNMGVPGDRAQYFATLGTKRVALMLAAGVTTAILELGVNDIMNASRTSANLLADRATIRALLPGVTWFDTTITPATTSSDNWQTATNQTTTGAGANTQRTTFNDALRAGSVLTSRIIDIAASVETSAANNVGPVLNGGVWIPGLIGFTDGTHPHSRCNEMLAPIVSRAIAFRR